jgi:imidazoleglycerol phosphate synthase glutamine amidotransferase subunit HisH
VVAPPPLFFLKNKIMIDFVNRNHFMGLAKHEERSQEIGMKSCKHEFFEALLNEELRC